MLVYNTWTLPFFPSGVSALSSRNHTYMLSFTLVSNHVNNLWPLRTSSKSTTRRPLVNHKVCKYYNFKLNLQQIVRLWTRGLFHPFRGSRLHKNFLKLCLYSDIDECKTSSMPCHEHAQCRNTDRSYMCTCNQGFDGDGHHNCTGKGYCN